MKLLRWLAALGLLGLLFFFGRETVRVFTNEDLWFLHYLW